MPTYVHPEAREAAERIRAFLAEFQEYPDHPGVVARAGYKDPAGLAPDTQVDLMYGDLRRVADALAAIEDAPLTGKQREILETLLAGSRLQANGMSEAGGVAASVSALARRGLVNAGTLELTDAGRKAARRIVGV